MQTFWINCLLFGLTVGGVASLNGWAERDSHEVIGGFTPSSESFKFVAHILFEDSSYCTGSLIAPRWILTAAHCVVEGDGSTVPVSAIRNITVAPESEDFEYYLGPHREENHIRRIVAHPDYSFAGEGFVNDIALIELKSSHGYYGRAHTPVRILNRDEEILYAPLGTEATAVGFGGGWSAVRLPLYIGAECRQAFDLANQNKVVHDRTICAGIVGDPTKGIRSGDSGGPLLVPIDTSTSGETIWGQIGVHSQRGKNRNGDPIVAIATRISSVYDWVESYLQSQTTQILTHVFAGPLANSTAKTEITITNTSPQACTTNVRFHRGTAEAPAGKIQWGRPARQSTANQHPGRNSPKVHNDKRRRRRPCRWSRLHRSGPTMCRQCAAGRSPLPRHPP